MPLDVGTPGDLDDVADAELLVARQVLGELLGRRGPRGRERGGPREAPRRGVGIEPRGDLRVVALRPGEVVGVELGDPEVRPVVGLDGAERVEAVGAQVVLEPRHRARGQGARRWCRQVGERQEGHGLHRHRARRQYPAAPSEALDTRAAGPVTGPDATDGQEDQDHHRAHQTAHRVVVGLRPAGRARPHGLRQQRPDGGGGPEGGHPGGGGPGGHQPPAGEVPGDVVEAEGGQHHQRQLPGRVGVPVEGGRPEPGDQGHEVQHRRVPVGAEQAHGDPGPEPDPEPAVPPAHQADQSGGDEGHAEVAPDAPPQQADHVHVARGGVQPEDRAEAVRQEVLGQAVGGEGGIGQPVPVVRPEVGERGVGDEGHEERRRQRHPGDAARRHLAHHRPPAPATGADHPEHGPQADEGPVDGRRLGEAGQDRERDRHRQEAPSAPPPLGCRRQGPFHPEQRQRQDRHRPDGRVGQPGVGTAQPEGHPGGGGEGASDPQPTDQGVGRPAGDQFEGDLEEQQAVVEHQEQRQGEEGTALHLAGQRGADALEGVPPRDVAVQPVEGGQVAECLGGVAGVRVDVGVAGEATGRPRAERGVDVQRVGRDQVEERRGVGHQDGDEDHDHGQGVRSQAGEGGPPRRHGATARSAVALRRH